MDMPEEHVAALEIAVAELLGVLELFPEEGADETVVERTAEGLYRYMEQVDRIGQAADLAGLPGLQDVCLLLQENLTNLAVHGQALDSAERERLEEWPALLMGYIADPSDAGMRTLLLEYLQNPAWDSPLPADDAVVLFDLLGVSMLSTEVSEDTLVTSETPPAADTSPTETVTATAQDQPAKPSETVAPVEVAAAEPATLTQVEPTDEIADDVVVVTPAALPEQSESTASQPEEMAMAAVTDEVEEVEEADEDEDDGDEEAGVDLSETYQELVDMLRVEIASIAESADEALTIVTSADSTLDSRRDILMSYAESLERLADATSALGLTGLQQVCIYLQINVSELALQAHPLSAEQRQVVEAWPPLALNYLQNFNSRSASTALAKHLQAEAWSQALPAADATELTEQLVSAEIVIEGFDPDVEAAAKPRHAMPEDVSLALPEDVNPQLLEGLLQELPGQAADFSSAIQRLSSGSGTLEDVKIAQRIAHTLKGAGNTVGVRGIATLTHHIEDILIAFSKHETLPNRPLANTLTNAADCLETMSEVLLGQNEPPSDALEVLQEVLDWTNRIDSEGVPSGDEAPAPRAKPEPVANSDAAAVPVSPVSEPASAPESTAATAQEAAPSLRVSAPLIDELLRLVGESIILTGQVQEQFRKIATQNRLIVGQNQLLLNLAGELEQLIDVRNVTSPLSRSIQRGDFDPLELEQYNELNTVTHRLVEAATDGREFSRTLSDNLTELDAMIVTQNRLQQSNQEAVLRTRMVPIQTIVPRLQRSVRQTCRLVDKDAELVISGADTLIDSNVLSDLVDPLMHILRNAVDHGIETPELRRQQGKNPAGRITLMISREGNNIVLRCQDDGSGLDMPTIHRIGVERGLINADDDLSDDGLARLILLPGFSTRSDTTQTSGRGIGMDIVYTRVLEMKGSLRLHSDAGQGCLTELRLPMTLLSTHGLLVRVRDQVLGISSRGIEQIVYSGVGQVQQLGDATTFRLGDAIHELTELEELLKLPPDHRTESRAIPPVLLVREESGNLRAVMVEDVLDSRDLVVKPLGAFIPKLNGIIGATILGDGSVAPVLDLPDMLRTPTSALAGLPQSAHEAAAHSRAPDQKFVLAVDDSLSARRALMQFAQDAGFEARAARDGLEAIEIIKGKRPDLVLADLEMPRMNGMELTAHLRANQETHDLPVIMITSRATEKHRHEAEKVGVDLYLTKPFMEDDLLSQIHKFMRNKNL